MEKDELHVMTIKYLMNDDLMHQWGILVYVLQKIVGAIAIPRYATKMVRSGIYEKEVETNASIEDMNRTIEILMALKNDKEFPEIVSVSIKEES